LEIIHHPVFYLKHNISETGCWVLHLQVEPTQLGPIARASLYVRTPATTQTGLTKPKNTNQQTPVSVVASVRRERERDRERETGSIY
jgi:hypothetical protein